MRLFHRLRKKDRELFLIPPAEFSKTSQADQIALALGGTLYAPATRGNLFTADRFRAGFPATSVALCLEDTVSKQEYRRAEETLSRNLAELDKLLESGTLAEDDLPLIFIRVRSSADFGPFLKKISPFYRLLTGFILPKFDLSNGRDYLDALASVQAPTPLYAMPILEASAVFYAENRGEQLFAIRELLLERKQRILNIRVGGTDLCGFYGLRRGVGQTIYDIAVARHCLEDILAVFTRPDARFVLSGPVWEHYSTQPEETAWLEGLLAELKLDKLNGFVGKTVIHPCQVAAVSAVHSVSHEEHVDAQAILAASQNNQRLIASSYGNKMNETLPHKQWAERVSEKARLFGVLRPGIGARDLL